MSAIASLATHNAATTTGALPAAGYDVGADTDSVGAEINVTVAGTTGTYQLEGSMDGINYVQVFCNPSDTEVTALSFTYTSTGRRLIFAKLDTGKFYRFYRINATTVTGQTFSATLFWIDKE